MVQAVVDLGDFENSVVGIVKGKYGLSSKSEAVNKIIQDCAEEYLAIRPEYIQRLRQISKEPGKKFKTPEELRKYLENG